MVQLKRLMRISLSVAVLIIIIITVYLLATSERTETRILPITDGPHEIVRDRDSIQLSDDTLLYSRTGIDIVKDNASGAMVEAWDNGTYVKDLRDGTEVKISDLVLKARISGNMVVWTDGDQIMIMNAFSGDISVLPLDDARPVSRPDIYQNYVVWADSRNDPVQEDDIDIVDIYMYDLGIKSEKRLTSEISSKGPPSIWGDMVVWADDRNGNFDIYAMDIGNGTELQITNDTHGQYSPKVSSRAIVWLDTRTSIHGWREDLFYINLDTMEEVQASNSGSVESFDLSLDKIVWVEMSLENRPYEEGDIFIHNITLNRTRLYYASEWGQWSAAVSGKTIVWADGSYQGGEVLKRRIIERPYLGIDLPTLMILLAIMIGATLSFGLYRLHIKKEDQWFEGSHKKASVKTASRGTKGSKKAPPEKKPPRKDRAHGRSRRRDPRQAMKGHDGGAMPSQTRGKTYSRNP